ncbi:hypothetical protein [Nocardia sienata]|uniref:hypothetical protein n=1 Tax=Nocardia sienata TaxID=248552 RepID=UPI0007A50292|nr:hypothetical protein [Nocardia sienata]
MGAWGVKALESDEGLEVVALVGEVSYGRAEVTADELVNAVRSEGLLGDDPAADEYLYDVTALALAEILTGDTAQLADPTFGQTVFVPTPEGIAVLVTWLTRLYGAGVNREFLELRSSDPRHSVHLTTVIGALGRIQDAR